MFSLMSSLGFVFHFCEDGAMSSFLGWFSNLCLWKKATIGAFILLEEASFPCEMTIVNLALLGLFANSTELPRLAEGEQ